jgi:ATP-binding cassette subfamily F protein uup
MMDGSGDVTEYIGGYDDWHKQIETTPAPPEKAKSEPSPRPESKADGKPGPRKLSYKEKLELEEIPKKIEALEAEQHDLNVKLETPEFYQQENALITQAVNRLQELHDELAVLYQRWAELES